MGFCPYCGEELEAQNTKFCSMCGVQLLSEPESVQDATIKGPTDEQPRPSDLRKLKEEARASAESALAAGEKVMMKAECNASYGITKGLPGTLFYTDNEVIVFVVSHGIINKQYIKHHWYNIASIQKAEVTSGSLLSHNKALVLEVMLPEGCTALRYERIPEPEAWLGCINAAQQTHYRAGG